MIENELQYIVTKERLADFEATLAMYSDESQKPPEVTPALWRAHKVAVRSQIYELQQQMAEYEATKAGL